MTDTRTASARPGDPSDPGAAAPEVSAPDAPASDATAPEIAVRLFAGAAAEFGADDATVHARTVGELVQALTAGASPEAARVIGRSSLLVDGVACTDHARALAPGTRVDVLPPFAGG